MDLALENITQTQMHWHNQWLHSGQDLSVSINGTSYTAQLTPRSTPVKHKGWIQIDTYSAPVQPQVWITLQINGEEIIFALNKPFLSLCQLNRAECLDLPNELLVLVLQHALTPFLLKVIGQYDTLEWVSAHLKAPSKVSFDHFLGLTVRDSQQENTTALAQFMMPESATQYFSPPDESLIRSPFQAAVAIPCPARFILGATSLRHSVLMNIGIGDVVMVKESRYPDSFIISIPDAAQYEACIENNLIKILSKRDGLMTDEHAPVSNDAATNLPEVESSSGVSVPLNIEQLPVKLTFELAQKTLPFRDVQALADGYCFELGLDISSPILMKANGSVIGECEMVKVAGRLGARVTRLNAKSDPQAK